MDNRKNTNITFIEKLVAKKRWRPTNIICTMLLIILLSLAFLMIYIFYINEIADDSSKKKLYFWVNAGEDSAYAEYLAEITETYNESNEDTEVILRTSFRDYVASVTYAYVKGYVPAEDNKTPDISLLSGEYLRDIIPMNNVLPLAKCIRGSDLIEYAVRTSDAGARNINSRDGVLYGLPIFVNTYRFIYNADAFLAAGIDPASGPEDINALIAANDKIYSYSAGRELSLRGYMISTAEMDKWFSAVEQIGRSSGIDTFDFTTLTRSYSKLNPIIKIFTQPKFTDTKNRISEDTILADFFAGTTVMTMTDYETLRRAEETAESAAAQASGEATPLQLNWNSSKIPQLAGSEQSNIGTAFSDVTYIHINGNTKYEKQAVKFVEYLLSDTVQSGFASKCGKIPADWRHMNKALTDIGIKSAYQSFFSFQNDTALPVIPQGQAVAGDSIDTLYEDIIKGNTDVETAIQELDERENKSLRSAIESGMIKSNEFIMGGEQYER